MLNDDCYIACCCCVGGAEWKELCQPPHPLHPLGVPSEKKVIKAYLCTYTLCRISSCLEEASLLTLLLKSPPSHQEKGPTTTFHLLLRWLDLLWLDQFRGETIFLRNPHQKIFCLNKRYKKTGFLVGQKSTKRRGTAVVTLDTFSPFFGLPIF